ncbi:hypothetical protein [Nocardia sp. NBC_01329]|uniref:hypothetical protein n=1 Tax=Nocardia sp. NBC_01329 TaxID=2903594 RepID=UPI002E10CF4B|nr:hypothetical protein OG405_15995 [Nocardia sp. NBC_01329]
MSDEINRSAQDDPEWVVWSSPERISERIDKLFTETLPGVPADWKTRTGSAKPIGPMPVGVDRYSDEMTLHWLDDAFDYVVPDEDVLFEPGNTELVNAFVAYIGDYFVRHCDGRWINDPEMQLFHSFGPTISYDWTDETDYPINLLLDAAAQKRFVVITTEWYSRSVDYAATHGLEHEGLELRRKHGLA